LNLKLKEYLKNHSSTAFFIALLCIVVSIAYYRVQIQIEVGPIWDTFDFLANAMFFAGQGYGYTDLIRPPLLPFLTSLIFRLGIISESVIFYIDALFLIIGTIGLYLFFKMRFEAMESFLGSLLFCTFPLVLLFTGVGLSDIPSLALTIWALYTTVLAVKNNPKYFYLSFLLAMLTFLTRYPTGFIIFPIFFYLIANHSKISLKHMIGGMLISFLPGLTVILFSYGQFGDPFYPINSFYTATQTTWWSANFTYYHPDPLYFLKNMLSYIGVGGVTIVSFMAISILFYLIIRYNLLKSKLKAILIKFNNLPKLNFLLIGIVFISFVTTFTQIHYLGSEVLFLILSLLIYNILSKNKIEHLDYDFLFISWFMAFFIFHSVYAIKDDRYFITMAPALSYFLLICFNGSKRLWGLQFKYKNFLSHTLTITVIVMILVSGLNYINEIPDTQSETTYRVGKIKETTQWLKDYDPQYHNKIIYSDQWPYFSWYLKMNVLQIPLNTQNFHENQSNIETADYFLLKEELNITNFHPIKDFGTIIIYQRQ